MRMAQGIIIGMVNGEQWSVIYFVCKNHMSVCFCAYCIYVHLYTNTLYKSCTSFTVDTLVIGVVLSPLYVRMYNPGPAGWVKHLLL